MANFLIGEKFGSTIRCRSRETCLNRDCGVGFSSTGRFPTGPFLSSRRERRHRKNHHLHAVLEKRPRTGRKGSVCDGGRTASRDFASGGFVGLGPAAIRASKELRYLGCISLFQRSSRDRWGQGSRSAEDSVGSRDLRKEVGSDAACYRPDYAVNLGR